MTHTAPRTDSAPAVVPRPDLLGDCLVMIGRTVRLTLRSPAVVASATFFPLVLLLLMTASFGRLVRPEGYAAYVNFSLPLFAVMGIVFSSLATGAAVFADLRDGFDARLRTLPMARSAPLVGRIVGDGVRNLASLLIVTATGSALGFRFDTGPLHIAGYFLLPLLLGFAVAWAVVTAAVRASSAEAVTSLLNAGLLLLSFLSTGFVPREELPGWVQPFAAVNPVSLVVEAMRALAHGGPLLVPLLRSGAWILALTAVFAPLAVRSYRRAR